MIHLELENFNDGLGQRANADAAFCAVKIACREVEPAGCLNFANI